MADSFFDGLNSPKRNIAPLIVVLARDGRNPQLTAEGSNQTYCNWRKLNGLNKKFVYSDPHCPPRLGLRGQRTVGPGSGTPTALAETPSHSSRSSTVNVPETPPPCAPRLSSGQKSQSLPYPSPMRISGGYLPSVGGIHFCSRAFETAGIACSFAETGMEI